MYDYVLCTYVAIVLTSRTSDGTGREALDRVVVRNRAMDQPPNPDAVSWSAYLLYLVGTEEVRAPNAISLV